MISMDSVRNKPIRNEIKILAKEGILGEMDKYASLDVCPNYIKAKCEQILSLVRLAESNDETEEEWKTYHGDKSSD